MRSTRQLEIVFALAEHRNFGRAAVALGVSQPSLTRSLKAIEERLGAPLFDRAGVTPTLFGEIVLRRGRSVLAGFAELEREIAMTKGLEVGALKVALGFYPADISGHVAAARLGLRHPNLSLDLQMMEWSRAYEAVLAGEADLGFVDIRAARENPDFATEPIRAGPLGFFCGSAHPLAGRETVTMADVMNHPWAGPSFPPPMGARVPKGEFPCGAFNAATGRFHPRIRVESFASAREIVLEGGALSAGFPFQIAAEVAAGRLVPLPTVIPFATLDYGFVWKRARALSPAACAFMAFAREIEALKGSEGAAPG